MNEQKQWKLSQLTERRKKCDSCNYIESTKDIHFFNAGNSEELDCDTIGQWTKWNGNLDADYMIVGQDWGTKDYLIKFRETQKTENYPCELDSTTNRNLAECVKQINPAWDILSLEGIQNNERYPLYFTNEILCYKDDKLMNASIPAGCYTECSLLFLIQQIEIVEPKVIILLGASTFRGFVQATKNCGLECQDNWSGNFADLIPMVLEERIAINYRTKSGKLVRVFPMWHPGGLGLCNAKTADIKKNGKRDIPALDILKEQWNMLGIITK